MTITRTRRLQKVVERFARSGREQVLHALHEVIALLVAFDPPAQNLLRERYRDHALRGDKKGIRELHLAQDDLLLYWVQIDKHHIVLLDIVTHEELRRGG